MENDSKQKIEGITRKRTGDKVNSQCINKASLLI